MIFTFKTAGEPQSVAILAGAFNPPTKAHVALANAALDVVDEVLFAIPRAFPHKQFEGATLEQRIDMLNCIAESQAGISVAVAEGGLFAEIAREAQPHYRSARIELLCGRDAAERILTWDYGDPEFVNRMLQEFGLLIAPRSGHYEAPPKFRHAIRNLHLANFDEFSSSNLRQRIAAGSDWRELAPEPIVELIERIYKNNYPR